MREVKKKKVSADEGGGRVGPAPPSGNKGREKKHREALHQMKHGRERLKDLKKKTPFKRVTEKTVQKEGDLMLDDRNEEEMWPGKALPSSQSAPPPPGRWWLSLSSSPSIPSSTVPAAGRGCSGRGARGSGAGPGLSGYPGACA
jgi:hypothetical protein